MMNIWLLTTEFPPMFGGGIGTYCLETAKMFVSQGHQITVVLPSEKVKTWKMSTLEQGIQLVEFNPSLDNDGDAVGYEARLSMSFAKVLTFMAQQMPLPDWVETQDYLGIGYFAMLKKKLLYEPFKQLNFVVTIHAPAFLYLDFNQVPTHRFPAFFVGEMEKACLAMADKIISPSNYIVSAITPYLGFQLPEVMRVFNPFEPQQLEIETENYSPGKVVFFGKLTPQKGCLALFAYFEKRWLAGDKTVLTIIGGGQHFYYPFQESMQQFLEKKYSQFIANKLVVFKGSLPPEKAMLEIQDAQVVVVPSTVDNLPYVVLETMAKGKIMLASKQGGQAEIITDGVDGFLFSHEENDFDEKLNEVLALSKNKRDQIGLNAMARMKTAFNFQTILKQKITCLENTTGTSFKNIFPFVTEIISCENKVNKSLTPALLSVVIPYYNLDELILETITSIEKSDFQNIEIIIVNDGSTNEKSKEILAQIKTSPTLIIHNQLNKGLSETRNVGAALANGEYLAFLDADDTVEPTYYSKAIDLLSHYHNVSFVGCWAQYFGESTDVWPAFNPEPPYFLTHNSINTSALVYKTNDFLSFGQNDTDMIFGMEDYESAINMVKHGKRGVALPEKLWNYRIRKNSMQQAFTPEKQLYLYKRIAEKHHDFFADYASGVANLLNHNGPGYTFDNPTWTASNIGRNRWVVKMKQHVVKNKVLYQIAKKMYSLISK